MLVGSEVWFPWQQTAPIGLNRGKSCQHWPYTFDQIFFIYAGNDNSHNILDEFGHLIIVELAALERLEIRAVAGQHSSPDLCFATKLIKIYDS